MGRRPHPSGTFALSSQLAGGALRRRGATPTDFAVSHRYRDFLAT